VHATNSERRFLAKTISGVVSLVWHTQVVKVDVERSLWAYTVGWSDEQRDEKRAALKRLLTAVVTRSGGDVHYYQVCCSMPSTVQSRVYAHIRLGHTKPSLLSCAGPARHRVCAAHDCGRRHGILPVGALDHMSAAGLHQVVYV
jgi:hypothetical protein